MKKIKTIIILMTLCLAAFVLTACSENSSTQKTSAEVTRLSFKDAASYDTLAELAGSKVMINGYMATSSPADGSFLFLMNLPYQSCPFCKPNTSQLSNTMEIYPEKGKSFDYTTLAISVTGTLEVAPENEPFTDNYGYEFNFKVVDASYVIMKDSDMSEEIALFQKIAQTDIINEIYNMYNYVNFVCCWPDYCVNSYTDADGNTVPGFYLYPTDAYNTISTDGAQWNYGYQEGYFDSIIQRIEDIDANAFSDLVDNIKKAQTLAEKGLKELEDGNYTSELKYLEEFDNEDYVFTLDKKEELSAEMDDLYYEFTDWLGKWEM